MKQWLAALCALGTMIYCTAVQANAASDSVTTALAAIENAKAGRGSLLMVGSILSSDDHPQNLGTGVIRDLRPDTLHAHGASATISVSDAVAREAARAHGTPMADPEGI